MPKLTQDQITQGLNKEQREAVVHGTRPLLIVAGAGTGKTMTLVHRVAQLIQGGLEPSRVLLLTFTRRAAREMLRRVDELLANLADSSGGRSGSRSTAKVWGGTFHATATRLLRMHGQAIGLNPAFTIHDRTDSEDLLDALRTELGLNAASQKFPKKETCLALHSHCVNAQLPLEQVVKTHYSWCQPYLAELRRLYGLYAERKQESAVLDYDDLLLFWLGLLSDPATGQRVRDRFDAVLVDEYQDTNRLQAEILQHLRPDGSRLTVVGDDAQSIYSFRAATVQNILEFPKQFTGTTVIALEQNYRSVQPILDASNDVIGQSKERYAKRLWTERTGGEKPALVTCSDDAEQAEFLVQRILSHRTAGIALKSQAVLFRASHNSIVLEAELARHHIPFVKYGGLRFVESAHVKDVLAFLRLAENSRDLVAGTRVLSLLPGIGPQKARQLLGLLLDAAGDLHCWEAAQVPQPAKPTWPKLIKLMHSLATDQQPSVAAQIRSVRKFYRPILATKYDNADARGQDLEQLQQLAERFADRTSLLADIALDPPTTNSEFAERSNQNEDFLVLSTVHSAKGLEWDVVYTISAADGSFPFHRATGSPEQIEEERRLFYVALTRAKNGLYVCFPQRSYQAWRGNYGDPYELARLTRFITPKIMKHFQSLSTRRRGRWRRLGTFVSVEVLTRREASHVRIRAATRECPCGSRTKKPRPLPRGPFRNDRSTRSVRDAWFLRPRGAAAGKSARSRCCARTPNRPTSCGC